MLKLQKIILFSSLSFFTFFFLIATGDMVNRGLGSKPKCWRISVILGDFFIYATKSSFSILALNKIIGLLELLTVICFYPKKRIKGETLPGKCLWKLKIRICDISPLDGCISVFCVQKMQRCSFWEALLKPHHFQCDFSEEAGAARTAQHCRLRGRLADC